MNINGRSTWLSLLRKSIYDAVRAGAALGSPWLAGEVSNSEAYSRGPLAGPCWLGGGAVPSARRHARGRRRRRRSLNACKGVLSRSSSFRPTAHSFDKSLQPAVCSQPYHPGSLDVSGETVWQLLFVSLLGRFGTRSLIGKEYWKHVAWHVECHGLKLYQRHNGTVLSTDACAVP